MNVYLLFYDHDHGDRENWNTFYTPVEVFDSIDKRQARIDALNIIDKTLITHCVDKEMNKTEFVHPLEEEVTLAVAHGVADGVACFESKNDKSAFENMMEALNPTQATRIKLDKSSEKYQELKQRESGLRDIINQCNEELYECAFDDPHRNNIKVTRCAATEALSDLVKELDKYE